VNEDDDKLRNPIIEEGSEEHSSHWGIQIILPRSQGEASIGAADATEGKQDETVMEEKEQILKSSPTGKEEDTVEMLTQWEMELKELEDCLNSSKPEGGFHEIAMLEETEKNEL
jgi:hypothetical protein